MRSRLDWKFALVPVLVALLILGARQVGTAGVWPFRNQQMGKLQVTVIDGRTGEALPEAEVVVAETEQRYRTGPDGKTPVVDAPVTRDPRFRPMIGELHGQLTVIAYKNGYRDSVYFGVRMHPGLMTEPTVFMYKILPQDTRIEPVHYQVPLHRIWIYELANKFRSTSQPGEGPPSPER